MSLRTADEIARLRQMARKRQFTPEADALDSRAAIRSVGDAGGIEPGMRALVNESRSYSRGRCDRVAEIRFLEDDELCPGIPPPQRSTTPEHKDARTVCTKAMEGPRGMRIEETEC